MTITITPEHLVAARRLTDAATTDDFTRDYMRVCLVAVAARTVDPSVTSVGMLTIRRGDRPLWFIADDNEAVVVESLITAFDGQRDDDVRAKLPFTFHVKEA